VNVSRDELLYILAPTEYSPVNANVGTTTSLSSIALQFAGGAPTNAGRFELCQKVSLGHVRVSEPLVAAIDAKVRLMALS
jgi:hypothetical protein